MRFEVDLGTQLTFHGLKIIHIAIHMPGNTDGEMQIFPREYLPIPSDRWDSAAQAKGARFVQQCMVEVMDNTTGSNDHGRASEIATCAKPQI